MFLKEKVDKDEKKINSLRKKKEMKEYERIY